MSTTSSVSVRLTEGEHAAADAAQDRPPQSVIPARRSHLPADNKRLDEWVTYDRLVGRPADDEDEKPLKAGQKRKHDESSGRVRTQFTARRPSERAASRRCSVAGCCCAYPTPK